MESGKVGRMESDRAEKPELLRAEWMESGKAKLKL